MQTNQLTGIILNTFIKIHTKLGPGLFESVYEEIAFYELTENIGLKVERQKDVPIFYDDLKFDKAFRLDLLVEDKVIIEIKSIKELEDVHYKQLQTYLKLMNLKDGILVNFNEALLKDGFKRVFNNQVY